MRAMAILYIGPHRNPDFASDYHLSPILAPSDLLAQFPPLLMSCGEKDPFVDDTVIFAGRVREAKRARKRELDIALAGQSVMYGEHLRMSTHDTSRDENIRMMKRERDELAGQEDEDWVRMQIFSEWSHGYLQMPMLMQEARTVIYDLADWIDEIFADRVDRPSSIRRGSSSRRARDVLLQSPHSDEASSSFASETETDDVLTFVPKKKSPPSSISGAVNGKAASSPSRADYPRALAAKLEAVKKESVDLNGRNSPHLYESPRQLDTPPLDVLTGYGGATHLIIETPTADFAHPPTEHPASHPASSVLRPPASSGYPSRNGTPGKAGQTITESEMMRRRRLLDSHLIPSGDGVNAGK